MDAKARLGWWVLTAVIVVTAVMELAQAGLSLQAGRFRGMQVVRVMLTGWLLWRVWDGAAWARWLLAGLFLAAAVLGLVFGVASPAVRGRPEVVALLVGLAAVCVALGLGLASPWVGAYQTSRRAGQDAEPGVTPDPAARSVSGTSRLPGAAGRWAGRSPGDPVR